MKYVLILLAVCSACTDERAPIKGTQSLQITITSPAVLGDINNRLSPTQLAVTATISALDVKGNVDTSYNNKLQVYVQFLGTLSPYFGGMPLATVQMNAGKGTLSTMLPPVFGPTTLWFDDGSDSSPTYATGVSQTLWYPDPSIRDIQMPDETSPTSLTNSPLENKNVTVNFSRHGASGRLIITSLFAQGYTLADVQCQDAQGTPPCVAGVPPAGQPPGYDYIEVYSYSAPQDQSKRFLNEGQIIDGFSGGVSNFDGLIEIGFPQTFVSGTTPNICTACEPAPVKVDASGNIATDWFTNPINFKRYQAAPIELDGGKVCNLDSDYTGFMQWKVDPAGVGGNCGGNSRVLNVITAGTLDVDPSTLVGKTVTKIVGTLRPIMLPGFDVWIIYPRSMADLQIN
jgi:hypothetical protein